MILDIEENSLVTSQELRDKTIKEKEIFIPNLPSQQHNKVVKLFLKLSKDRFRKFKILKKDNKKTGKVYGLKYEGRKL